MNDIYYAEKLIVKALPGMSTLAKSAELKTGFTTHLDQTQRHVQRLDKVFEIIGKVPQGETCEAVQVIIQRAKEMMDEYGGSPALDDGLISSARTLRNRALWHASSVGRATWL